MLEFKPKEGFLLTRSSRDVGNQIQIEYWLSTEQGASKVVVASERSVFFIETSIARKVQAELCKVIPTIEVIDLELQNFNGKPLSAVYAKTLNQFYQARDYLINRGIETLESDFRPHDRYLIERFIRGSTAFIGNERVEQSHTVIESAKLKPSEYEPTLCSLSLDIECAMDGRLFSVGLATDRHSPRMTREVIMIGDPEPAQTNIIWVNSERGLLTKLCERVSYIDPDILIGWNLINFDLRILIERAAKLNVELTLGRDNSMALWRPRRNDAHRGYVSIAGRVAIDGIEALKSATWQFPSFSLESVAQTLLNRGKKVEADVDDRLAEIVHNFNHNKPALAAYNLEDCVLVLDIFENTKILDYLILRSKMTGLELDRAAGSVAAFTNLYLPQLHRSGYIAPNLPENGGLASPGGYVMESIPGLYKNVLVLDFKSLYPSIIRTFKIDPMGLIEGLNNPEESIEGFRGAKFSRDRHFLPKIIEDLWKQRDQAKLENEPVRSQAIKIIMNSFYGVLGSGGCRFYDPRLASSITLRGHQIMMETKQWIENNGFKVIYGDTDSTFVLLDESLDAEECMTIGDQLTDNINQFWRDKLRQDHRLDCYLEMEFETHFRRFLMPTIRGSEAGSKKRYAGLVIDQNTQKEKLIFKGLENVRTDWTELARDFQETLFDQVFHDQDPSNFVCKTVQQTLAGKNDHKLIYTKQLRRKLDKYVKNVPPQVRAARMADEQNAALGKSLKYQNKGWISYVITVNGPEPLEFNHSRLDYDHYVSKQLKPIADGILPLVGLNFDQLVSPQAQLFL